MSISEIFDYKNKLDFASIKLNFFNQVCCLSTYCNMVTWFYFSIAAVNGAVSWKYFFSFFILTDDNFFLLLLDCTVCGLKIQPA